MNKLYNIDKVDDIIGLKEKKYDKIDVFSERINPDNLFGILYYTEYKNEKPIVNQEIVKFNNFKDMIDFLKKNFDTYELDHYIRDDLKHIFFHYADYLGVDYYLHDGKPNKNYVVFKYREYANNTFYPGEIKFSRDYEKLLLDITYRSNPMNRPNYGRTVDVKEERKINRTENYQKYTRTIGDLIKVSGEKLRGVKDNQRIVRNLKLIMGTTALASFLASGISLITDNAIHSDYLEQENMIRNTRDIGVYINKGHAGKIIEKLMQERYDEVTGEELDFLFDFINTVDESNYDKNDSYNMYDLDNYFDHYLFNQDNYSELHAMLDKIERLYRRIFVVSDNKLEINNEEAREYIDYVSSFTFMYDTYRNTRPTNLVPLYNDNINANLANVSNIELYDSLPPILRLIILNQLKGVVAHADYKVANKPSYYFKSLDKYGLLGEIKDLILETEDELLFNCTRNYKV